MAERRTCKGCQDVFHIESFFRHVAYTKSCKAAYKDEWPDMLKEKKKLANKRSYKKNKDKIKEKAKWKYHKYPEIKERKKSKYMANKDQINEQSREKYKKEITEKYAREDKRIRERPGNTVRQHVRIMRSKAKKLNNYCEERFPEVWGEKMKQIEKDYPKSTKKIIKKLKNDLKAAEDICKVVNSEIDHEIQKIFDSLEEKPSLISTYYLNLKKLDKCFDYEVYPKWLELFNTMKKRLSKLMKRNGHECIYYYWSDKTKKYEYLDEESEMLESFEKCLRKGKAPEMNILLSDTDSSDDSSDTDSSDGTSDENKTDGDLSDENEATFKIERCPKKCEGCGKTFEFESFLKHVTHKKICSEKYGDERIQVMKQNHRTAAWKQYEKKDKDAKWKVTEELLSEFPEEATLENGYVRVCDGCKEKFGYDDLFRHVSHSKDCLTAYGSEKWRKMRHERKTYVQKRKSEKRSKKSLGLKKSVIKPNHFDFEKELKKSECSVEREIVEVSNCMCEPVYGGIYYFKMINKTIAKPNVQISDLVKQLESDIEALSDLRKQLDERFAELKKTIRSIPGFDTFVQGSDGHKDVQKRLDDFTTQVKEEGSRYKNLIGERFAALGSLLNIDNSKWREHYKKYHLSYFGCGNDREVMRSAEFMKCCEKASKIPQCNSNQDTTNMDPTREIAKDVEKDKQINEKEDSPKVIQKPFFHKRKKIDFKMSDLESAVEDEDDSDFVA